MMLPVIVPPQGGVRLMSEVPLLDSPRLSLLGLRSNRGTSQCRAKTSSSSTRASIPQKEHHYGHLTSGQDHVRAVRGSAVVNRENDIDNYTFDNLRTNSASFHGDSNSASFHGEKITVSVRIHSVSAGETVSSIASSYSIPVDALLAANDKSSPSIRVGESQASQSGRSQHVSLHIRENHGTSSRHPDTRVNESAAAPCEGVSPALLVTSAPAAPAAAAAVAADASAGASTAANAPHAHSHAASFADTPSPTSAAAEYENRRFADELSGFANFFAARKHLDGWRKGPGEGRVGTHVGSDGSRQGVVASVTQALVPVRGVEVQQSLPLIGLGFAITVTAGALAVRSGLHGLVRAAFLLRLQGFSQWQRDQRQQQQEQEREQQGEGSEQKAESNEQQSLQRVRDNKRLEFSKRALRNYLDLQKREVKRSGMEGAALRLKMRMAKANGKDPLPFAPLQDKMGSRRSVMTEIRNVVAEAVAEVVEGEECTVVIERSKALVKDSEGTGESREVEKGIMMGNGTGGGAEEAGRMIEMMEKGWYGGAGKTEMKEMMGLEGDEDGLGEVGPEVFLEWSVEKARETNAHAMGYTKERS
ncbi:unnamed protein product [Closterium sp. Yama58-4]|nr:unnamed protein product [Closterium sp. Yama58-4]